MNMVRNLIASIGAVIWAERQELVVMLAVALWAASWWTVDFTFAKPLAVGVPALVVLWYALPSRPPFILRSDGKDRA